MLIFGSLAAVAALGTASLAVAACGSSATAGATAGADDEQQKELAESMTKYPNAIDQTGGKVAVSEGAFVDRTDLPAGFTLPLLVTSVKAHAFKGAKLPANFAVPAGAVDLDATAFEKGRHWRKRLVGQVPGCGWV